jgi:hypothetical protein
MTHRRRGGMKGRTRDPRHDDEKRPMKWAVELESVDSEGDLERVLGHMFDPRACGITRKNPYDHNSLPKGRKARKAEIARRDEARRLRRAETVRALAERFPRVD